MKRGEEEREREGERERKKERFRGKGFFRGQKKVAHLRNARVRVRGRFVDKGNS